MRHSIATVSLSGTLPDKLRAAAAAGFDAVELFDNDLSASTLDPAGVRALAESLGLGIDLYQPLRDLEAVPDAHVAATRRRAEAKFAVARQLGAGTVLACSNASESAVDDDARAAEQLWHLAERAREHGVRIAYEALAWGRHVDTFARAWRIVAMADHPDLGLCLDSFHALSRGEDPAAIREIPADKIFFLQLADAPDLALDVLRWSRHYRCFPGQGGFDLAGFTGHVLAAGYDGPLSLEIFNDVFRATDPERTAADARRSLLVLEDALGPAPERAPDRPSVRLRKLPRPQEPSGYSFVEVAAPGGAGDRLRAVLAALGLRHTASHRSKPVELWQAGGTRLVLSDADPYQGRTWDSDAAVTALGVEVPDPDTAAERARALLAPALPRRRDPAEAELPAFAAPDGTALFLCGGPGPGAGWLEDFAPLPGGPGPEAPEPVDGVDHVGLFEPFDHFDEAALFYRSALRLGAAESTEVAAPDGLVRSRALATSGAALRLVLNVSVLGRGRRAHAAGGTQHVAFHCGDIVAAAERLRAAGAGPLAIPENYYRDLESRTELPPVRLARMRRLGILYDTDPDGGEFYHCYTPLLSARLFVEVVQRVGGYAGYGAVNAPVRMAAHHAAAAGAA